MDVRDEAAMGHAKVLSSGDHLLSQLRLTDVEVPGADLAIALDLEPRLMNPQGGLQGGLIATLVDIVAGRAANAGLREGVAAVTSDLHVHYLASVRAGPAVAVARTARRGRRSTVVQVEVFDGHNGPLAAVCTVGWAVIGGGR